MLDKRLIEDIIMAALSTGGDFAEVFVEDKYNTGITMIGGKVDNSISGRDFGVGIRIFKGFNSVYAYTNQFDRESLIHTAIKASGAIQGMKQDRVLDFIRYDYNNINPIRFLPKEIKKSKKVNVMREAYEAAQGYSDLISQVTVRYIDEDQKILVANSEGRFAEDQRVRTRIAIQSIASKNNEMQTGSYSPGAHMGFEFYDKIDVKEYGREASRIAVTMLDAEPCPSGKFQVIIDNEFGGVIFHEACGHGLEATSVAKKNSVFADRIGEQVASSVVTAIDDGTIQNAWGSANIDDEGEPTKKNVLIENGILKGYLIDKLNARRMEMTVTGSSRRESYKYAPTSRMTNTYIAAGKSTPEEIIANTEFGIYAKYMGGGSVNPATGDFNFAVMEGYLVKNGKIDKPLRGATLIGNGPNILHKIDMVGNNLDYGQGMCGSVSGSIPTDVGQPTIRVNEITVGGR
ncbi:TldD/PmbA family protein [Alkaliphilus oremlandii]|uniref:Peptidase U62 modulator of DNA gyrase n=1 Tax=Alkaliphilus oremlandii (strain OhILAs) TaxID=350688 RepID=A8MIJ2_ALKOO|nr:TldD/PmbA family protein [Alkaliphilus oremlandii]ABW19624.1 peptidase U62 modulator of DNA gyrase [Alkaliphilus oremlandii OhILAs]